ncbi:zinc finger domain-containing protein [Streptomyces parvus]|uniref:zinc finger domain-containing protein n=1 Tax=Streptomyces parvus TaxID=66428 RepID=UPI00406BB771
MPEPGLRQSRVRHRPYAEKVSHSHKQPFLGARSRTADESGPGRGFTVTTRSHAQPGSPCRSRSGAVAGTYHTGRFTKAPRLAKPRRVPTPADRGPGQPGREHPSPHDRHRHEDPIALRHVRAAGRDASSTTVDSRERARAIPFREGSRGGLTWQ